MPAAVIETLRARDLMTREVVTVPPTMPVAALARLLSQRGISAVPVTAADGRLLGIVTELDLIRRLGGTEERKPGWFQRLVADPDRAAERYAQVHGALAEDVMTVEVLTVEEGATAGEMARLLEQRGIRRLPVLRDGRLVGIVARADLLQALLAPPARPGNGAAEDERIREAIWKELREQPWADTFYTFVSVRNGVVEFQGYARSPAVRRGLHAIAHRVEGVRRVEDHMEEGLPITALY